MYPLLIVLYILFQIPGITDIGLLPRKINKVVIIGGSSMSSGIATMLVLANHRVIMKYTDQNSLQNGINRVKGEKQLRSPLDYS